MHFSFLLPGLSVQPAAISRLPPSKGPCPKPQEPHRPTEANSYSRPHGHMATPRGAGASIFLSPFGPLSLPVVLSHLPAPATPAWRLNESTGQGVLWGQTSGHFLKSEGAKRRRLLCLAGGQGRLREVDGSAEQRGRVQRGEGVGRLRDARQLGRAGLRVRAMGSHRTPGSDASPGGCRLLKAGVKEPNWQFEGTSRRRHGGWTGV